MRSRYVRSYENDRDTDYEPSQDDAPQRAHHHMVLIGACAFLGLVIAVVLLHGWN